MKFEEIPVNNYTGIPDISLPIYTMPTLSKEVTINLALKYHPSSIQKDEMAGYTGLGWSLIAGGSISRTVRGLPDEIVVYGNESTGPESTGKKQSRIGIYNTNDSNPYFSNRYYQVMGLFGNFTTPSERDIIAEYCWKAFEKGIFDSDHDLYQFNFMGKTGRFYIKKNTTTGQLEAVNLFNDQSIKIIVNSTMIGGKHNFTSFTIYDDKGFRYEFEDKEVTSDQTLTASMPFYGSDSINSTDALVYSSGFQLSKIYDTNNQLLVTFSYTNVVETITRRTAMTNRIEPHTLESDIVYQLGGMNGFKIQGMLPKSVNTSKTTTIDTKKLSTILVVNKGRIEFENQAGREDYNMTGGSKLKRIVVKNLGLANTVVKSFELDYDYFRVQPPNANPNSSKKRLALMGLIEKPATGNGQLKHKLLYKNMYMEEDKLNYDKWGYPNNNDIYKPVMKEGDATGILQKIIFPTGGAVGFDFGSNTYSYVGTEALTDFTQNPDNWDYTPMQFTLVAGPGSMSVFEPLAAHLTTRYLTLSYSAEGTLGNEHIVSVWELNPITGQYNVNVQSVNSEYVLLPGKQYAVRFSWLLGGTSSSASFDLRFRSLKPQ